MTAISATAMGNMPMAGIHRDVQGTNTTRGTCKAVTNSIVSQNHLQFLSSQRTFVAIRSTIAEIHAARPFPGFPKESNKKKSGEVKIAMPRDQKYRFQLISFAMVFSKSTTRQPSCWRYLACCGRVVGNGDTDNFLPSKQVWPVLGSNYQEIRNWVLLIHLQLTVFDFVD